MEELKKVVLNVAIKFAKLVEKQIDEEMALAEREHGQCYQNSTIGNQIKMLGYLIINLTRMEDLAEKID